jgi:8-amino-7-oxononanoate synthase
MQNLAFALTERRRQGLYRQRQTLSGPQGVRLTVDGSDYLSFCSNDYLGLANHPAVRSAFIEGIERFGTGSGAAHLITGHSYAHAALEEDLAEFIGCPRVLVFSTGYMANLGVMDALLDERATIYEDRLNHASLLDGARLTGARLKRFRHADPAALESKFAAGNPQARELIATDGVFSMDGDCAPLKALSEVAERRGSWLLVDDAHGFGVVGDQGRGWLFDQLGAPGRHQILMATLGKACGTFGAFVAGDEDLIETLIQHARTYIYTTAPPPALAWATRAALRQLQQAEERRRHLRDLIRRFRDGAAQRGLPVGASDTPIQPVIVGDAATASGLSDALRRQGVLVTAIRPPTVPRGSARLRVTFSADHTGADVECLLDALGNAYGELNP